MEGIGGGLGLAFGSCRVYPRFSGLHVLRLVLMVERGRRGGVGSLNGYWVGTTNVVKQACKQGNKERQTTVLFYSALYHYHVNLKYEDDNRLHQRFRIICIRRSMLRSSDERTENGDAERGLSGRQEKKT